MPVPQPKSNTTESAENPPRSANRSTYATGHGLCVRTRRLRSRGAFWLSGCLATCSAPECGRGRGADLTPLRCRKSRGPQDLLICKVAPSHATIGAPHLKEGQREDQELTEGYSWGGPDLEICWQLFVVVLKHLPASPRRLEAKGCVSAGLKGEGLGRGCTGQRPAWLSGTGCSLRPLV
jgi:hypothetical protein